VGSLQFDRNEKLIFEPKVHENFLLDAFGMEGFQFPLLEHKEIMSTKRVFTDKEAVRPVFSSRKVKALVVGIPILLALIFIPVSKYTWNNNPNTQVSSTASIPTSIMGTPVVTAAIDSVAVIKIPLKVDSASTPTKEITPNPPQAVTIQSEGRYRVIGGYFKSRQNAEKFLEKLKASGFKSNLKVLPNQSFLVIVQSYSDKNEAVMALKILREAEPQTGYWMSAN